MRKLWLNNGLSIVTFAIFLMLLAGQSLVGWHEHNDELNEHHANSLTFLEYLRSGSFVEVTMENWESEFLQMFAYIVLTTFLYQKGSAESKPPGATTDVDRDARTIPRRADMPLAVRLGGWWLWLYERSLSLTFLLLFVFTFAMHAEGGMHSINVERTLHGEAPLELLQYLSGSRFWYESLQNWQSEFLAIWSMVVLSIFLRQRGSPESKPVDMAHSETPE